jgi:hypothetical protein
MKPVQSFLVPVPFTEREAQSGDILSSLRPDAVAEPAQVTHGSNTLSNDER